MNNDVTVLPDGSAFAVGSLPLPKDHWLYAPRGEWDSDRDEYAEYPMPILTNAHREAVMVAARYAIRGATMCGQDMDFDPDALVRNLACALCGPAPGWMESAMQMARNADFYRGLLDQCAEHLGLAAYTADDGTVMGTPVRLKIPELVAELVAAKQKGVDQ